MHSAWFYVCSEIMGENSYLMEIVITGKPMFTTHENEAIHFTSREVALVMCDYVKVARPILKPWVRKCYEGYKDLL